MERTTTKPTPVEAPGVCRKCCLAIAPGQLYATSHGRVEHIGPCPTLDGTRAAFRELRATFPY